MPWRPDRGCRRSPGGASRASLLAVLLGALVLPSGVQASGGAATIASGSAKAAEARSVLYVWAGDKGTSSPLDPLVANEYDAPDDEDFLAVVDADPASSTYGRVLSTVSVPTPPVGNEPHHLPPFLPPGCSVLVANALFSDSWFTFDVSTPLRPVATGAIGAEQTFGTVPQFGGFLPNCEVIGTEQGGPSFEAHGTVVRLDPGAGAVLEERTADRVPRDVSCGSQWNLDPHETGPGGPFAPKTDESDCLPAVPQGIAVRPDLGAVVTSDYAIPGRLILPAEPAADVTAMTVRHYRLNAACAGRTRPAEGSVCVGTPHVVLLPDGPRQEVDRRHEENVAVEGLAATHGAGKLNPTGSTPTGYLPARGAFAQTTCGGALYYTGDVAATRPLWREVFDFSTANEAVVPGSRVAAGCVGGGGLLVSADNRYLFASVIGREEGQEATPIGKTGDTRRFAGMVVMLDIARLVRAGTSVSCIIDEPAEVWEGGSEADCPTVAGIHVVDDPTSGGPHDIALDYPNGGRRLAFFDYFVSETGVGGDLRVCILAVEGRRLLPDAAFGAADESGPDTGCISFDRSDWPGDRGPGAGAAKPHHGLFRNRG